MAPSQLRCRYGKVRPTLGAARAVDLVALRCIKGAWA